MDELKKNRVDELKKIREGMSGNEAAQVIYDNYSDLLDKITACNDTIEANKAYVAQIDKFGTIVEIPIAHTTGYTVDCVMSQSSVTKEFDKINNDLENRCVMMLDLDIPEKLDPPATDVVNATYSLHATKDDEGHVLSQMYDDIRDLQKMVAKIDTLKTQIADLKRRVNVLESKLNEV